MEKNKLIISVLILCLCGNAINSFAQQKFTQMTLAENLSEQEFKEAIIGKWESVWNYPDKENIKYLELYKSGKANIVLVKNGAKKEIKGAYKIDFLRAPVKNMVTFAQITINSPQGIYILSRVNFGLHNGAPIRQGLLLRIDSEPYGALERILNEKCNNSITNESSRPVRRAP